MVCFSLSDLVSFLFSSFIVHLRNGHTFEASWEKSEAKSSVKEEFFLFLSRLNCLLSWDKNLINYDFHRRRLREVKLFNVADLFL